MNKLILTAIPLACALSVSAQQNTLTTKDYERAESRLSYGTEPYIDHGSVRPDWLPGDKFWYRSLTANGSEFILVDPAKKSRSAAFDQSKLAVSLSAATGKKYSAEMLPFNSFSFTADDKAVIFKADDQQWKCDLSTYAVIRDDSKIESRGGNAGARRRGVSIEVPSPDGSKVAYIKDWNLWVRDVATGTKTRLTTDGIKDYGYATDNAGWKSSDGAVLRWSPDSKKIATFKDDQREVGNMYLVTTNVGHPTLKEWKYPLPGDKVIPMIERVIIDVDNPKVIRLQVPALTEEEITNTIRELSSQKGQITILIAHRLSTIMHADRIYVLEKGDVVETGSHEKLLEEKGLYYAMWRQQIGERKKQTLATPALN